MLCTTELLSWMRAHTIDQDTLEIDAPANSPIMAQATADGYADQRDGRWFGRGMIQPGERRILRHSPEAGGDMDEIIG